MKKLGFFLTLLFSANSYANPLIAAYESSMTSYLAGAGLSQIDAQREAANMSAFAFGGKGQSNEVSDSKGCVRAGRSSCQKVTVGETVLNYNKEGKLDFISQTDKTVSELKSMARLSNYSSEDILKFLYKDGQLGDLVFQQTYKRDEFIDKLMSYVNYDVGEIALAPEWYDSTGMFLYRTAEPVDGENYLYFNNYRNLYSGYWSHLENIKPYSENEEGFLDLTDDYRALIYQSYYKPIDIKDTDSRSRSDYFQRVNKFPSDQFLPIQKHVFELSKDDISSHIVQAKQIAEDEGISLDEAYETSFESVDRLLFTTIENLNVPVSIVQPRSDLKNENDLAVEEEKENIEIVHRTGSIESEAKKSYLVTPKSLADSFENMKNDYFVHSGSSVRTSNGSTVNIDTSKKVTELDLAGVSTGTDKRVMQLGTFVERASSIDAYDTYRKANPIAKSDPVDGVREENKPMPPVSGAVEGVDIKHMPPVSGTVEGVDIRHMPPVSGVVEGVDTKPPIAGTNTGVDVSHSAAIPKSNVNSDVIAGAGASSIAVTATATGEIARDSTKEEEKADYRDPDLAVITGGEILEPLVNLKDSLLSKMDFNIPSGSCPIFDIDFFGQNLKLEAHCVVFEKIAGSIGLLFLLIYNIFAIRIILSS